MPNYTDLYLGGFLIVSGFALSLLNLRRIIKSSKPSIPAVLLSENILLTCIGVAFISRSLYELAPLNTEMHNLEERSTDIMKTEEINCGFASTLMSYGPLIVSLVNSFVSLVIDNYMHYKMIANVKQSEDESAVRELSENFRVDNRIQIKDLLSFVKRYFSFITIGIQWIVPIVIALSMYSIDVKEKILMNTNRELGDSCMALVDVNKENCSLLLNVNDSLQLREYLPKQNYLQMYESELFNNSNNNIETVVNNVYKILSDLHNETHYSEISVTSDLLWRKPRQGLNQNCMKICFLENKKLLLYMFGVSIVSYFIPITISTIILTRIHIMDVKNKNVKTYVNRELFYNILFWTPVMFDTFLSITLCSYSMSGMKSSIFNVIANVYQAVKNFMNTKYFKDNSVVPV